MSEILRVVHGTSREIVGKNVLQKKSPLVGKTLVGDPAWSGSLTEMYSYAEQVARRRPGAPIVLVYEIPRDELIVEGPVGHADVGLAYSTIFQIPFVEIPEIVFKHLKQFNLLEKSTVQYMMNEQGTLQFHQVPSKYLVDVVDLP